MSIEAAPDTKQPSGAIQDGYDMPRYPVFFQIAGADNTLLTGEGQYPIRW
ncbi:MAG: hypothetical protein AMXMBFR84_16850 [Candidatus Hydrogenedentota bacterium]